MVLQDHKCFMQKQNPKPPSESLIFFDFETTAESNEHRVVNFAVAQDFRGDTFVYEGCDALQYYGCVYHSHNK